MTRTRTADRKRLQMKTVTAAPTRASTPNWAEPRRCTRDPAAVSTVTLITQSNHLKRNVAFSLLHLQLEAAQKSNSCISLHGEKKQTYLMLFPFSRGFLKLYISDTFIRVHLQIPLNLQFSCCRCVSCGSDFPRGTFRISASGPNTTRRGAFRSDCRPNNNNNSRDRRCLIEMVKSWKCNVISKPVRLTGDPVTSNLNSSDSKRDDVSWSHSAFRMFQIVFMFNGVKIIIALFQLRL